jgi:hypothetical protein
VRNRLGVAFVRHWLSYSKVTALYGDFIAKGQSGLKSGRASMAVVRAAANHRGAPNCSLTRLDIGKWMGCRQRSFDRHLSRETKAHRTQIKTRLNVPSRRQEENDRVISTDAIRCIRSQADAVERTVRKPHTGSRSRTRKKRAGTTRRTPPKTPKGSTGQAPGGKVSRSGDRRRATPKT